VTVAYFASPSSTSNRAAWHDRVGANHGGEGEMLAGLTNTILFLVIATTLEVCGDAVVRLAIYDYAGLYRIGLFLLGALLLLGYGSFLNLAPVEFGQVVGLYIATLFIVWQVVNYAFFRTLPTLPILAGGSLIILGGLIVTFWRPGISP
jgi:hypothetical protein